MPDAVAIGIDVGGTKLVAATLAEDGRLLERVRRDTPAKDERRLVEELSSLVRELGRGLPVGVGIAGLVGGDGVVRYGPNIAVRDLDLAGPLSEVASAPVVVVNDASAAALGEQRTGAARGCQDVVLLTLGTGVGGGLVVGGRLVVGASGFGGELGHVTVERDGRRCPCGAHGCVEAYASGTAIGLRARQWLETSDVPSRLRDLDEVSGRAVSRAATEGDGLARDVLEEAGGWLGVALASCVNALDPEIVLLGGGAAAETAPWIVPAAEAQMRSCIIGKDWRQPPPIALAELGDDAGMVGAGLLVAGRAPAL